MKEIKQILEVYDSLDKNQIKLALATVIEVKGSSYRRTGARMLIQDNGNWTGGISGGCIEGDALKKAHLAMASGKPVTTTYDTSNKAEEQIGVSLGCNGVITVLITPVSVNDPNNPVECLRPLLDTRKEVVIISVINSELPDIEEGKVYFDALEGFPFGILAKDDSELLNQNIDQVISSGKSIISKHQKASFFIERINPSIKLIVMGNNYDIYPLLRQANELNWDTVVVANPKKLDKLAFELADVEDDFDKVTIDRYTAGIIMSHNYPKDKSNLKKALASDLQYIGLLGPASRRDDILSDLEINYNDKALNRLFGPAGMDIGANQPEEIGLSIIAEIISVMRNREGGSLKKRNAPINPR